MGYDDLLGAGVRKRLGGKWVEGVALGAGTYGHIIRCVLYMDFQSGSKVRTKNDQVQHRATVTSREHTWMVSSF